MTDAATRAGNAELLSLAQRLDDHSSIFDREEREREAVDLRSAATAIRAFAQRQPDCGALRSTMEDIIAIYQWCSVDPVDRGYSALDNEIIRAKRLLATTALSAGDGK